MSSKLFNVKTLEDLGDALPWSDYKTICEALKKDYAENYRRFMIPKKNGGVRVIQSPQGEIKRVQTAISSMLAWIYINYAPKAAHGLMKRRSIVGNALPHVQKQWVLNFDLQDFYGTISEKRVAGLFRAIPFYLPDEIADTLAKLTTTPIGLPQGAPSSPVIANMIAYQLDLSLTQFAKNYDYDYTRYADDITLSSNKPFAAKIVAFNPTNKQYSLGEKLLTIIEDCGFRVNPAKTRLQHRHERQVVTGLTVNDKPNVDRKYIRNIEGMIHAIQKYGANAVLKFNQRYAKEAIPLELPFSVKVDYFISTLLGRLSFVKMVKGQDDPVYKRLIASIHQEAFSVDEPARDSGKEIIQSLKACLTVKTANNEPALQKMIREFVSSDNFYNNLPRDKRAFTKLTELDLDGCDLTSLPEFIAKFAKLTKLSLKNNQITSLPEWIGLLTNLTELDLSSNQLSSLPDAITKLKNLKKLTLRHNQCYSLPETISNLTNLTELDLSFNRLSNLPESIVNLTNLKVLYLKANEFTCIRETITNLTNLTGLDLSSNKLSSLPDSIGNLTKLDHLFLYINCITSLPETIESLTNLAVLNLGYNQLTTLPESIGNLTNLTVIRLGDNQLSSIPESIGNLTSLHHLILNNNRVSSLPRTIGSLTNIAILNLEYNQLSSLPETIANLTNLIDIDLGYNQLTSLPKNIANLTKLKKIKLCMNPLPRSEIDTLSRLVPKCEVLHDESDIPF